MSSDAAQKAQLRSQLIDGCQAVPIRAFQQWDVTRVRKFKECIKKSKKLAANPRATVTELTSQINELSSFWR